jgi:hypothetical protein
MKIHVLIGVMAGVIGVIISSIVGDVDIFGLAIIGVSVFFISSFSSFLLDKSGKHKHRRFVKGRIARTLIEQLDFQLESHNQYHGLKGSYKDYFFRIYYNWLPPGDIFASNSICVVLNFIPPKNAAGKLDTIRLDALHEKYKSRSFFREKSVIRIEASSLTVHHGVNILTRARHIIKQIENSIRIAEHENLPAISESEVQALIEKDAFLYSPDIETFNT